MTRTQQWRLRREEKNQCCLLRIILNISSVDFNNTIMLDFALKAIELKCACVLCEGKYTFSKKVYMSSISDKKKKTIHNLKYKPIYL